MPPQYCQRCQCATRRRQPPGGAAGDAMSEAEPQRGHLKADDADATHGPITWQWQEPPPRLKQAVGAVAPPIQPEVEQVRLPAASAAARPIGPVQPQAIERRHRAVCHRDPRKLRPRHRIVSGDIGMMTKRQPTVGQLNVTMRRPGRQAEDAVRYLGCQRMCGRASHQTQYIARPPPPFGRSRQRPRGFEANDLGPPSRRNRPRAAPLLDGRRFARLIR